MIKKSKQEKAITLIALIITIVILLILAVVAITSIQNDSIIEYANNAVTGYENKQDNENLKLDEYEDFILSYKPGGNGGAKTYTAYTVGQKVKLKDTSKEPGTFYVIKNTSATEEIVLLLTEKFIHTEDLIQSSSANKVKFSETAYWADKEGITYPYDLTQEVYDGEPESSHNALYAAYRYAKKIGEEKALGRLMKSEEAKDLAVDYESIIYVGGFDYALGTAFEDPSWFGVYYGVGRVHGQEKLITDTMGSNMKMYVRPVIEISKDLVELVTE